jgi:hypothetical protein
VGKKNSAQNVANPTKETLLLRILFTKFLMVFSALMQNSGKQ